MVNIQSLIQGIRLPFDGRKNSQAGGTATTSSSTTDVTSQLDWADPEKAEAARIQAAIQYEANQTEQTPGRSPWPLWMKLAMAGCAFAIIAGLAVGLGVGLTRHKHSDHHHTGNSSSGGNGSSPDSSPPPKPPATVAVYWGAKLKTVSLDTVCEDPSYDIVNLSFLSAFFATGQYPRLAIPSLNGSSEAQRLAGAADLQDGTALMPAIRKCQAGGKRVLLSMGGAAGYADVRVASDTQGRQVADMIWHLFLGGDEKPELRPFGDVVLDGVDFGMFYTQSIHNELDNDSRLI